MNNNWFVDNYFFHFWGVFLPIFDIAAYITIFVDSRGMVELLFIHKVKHLIFIGSMVQQ